MLDFCLGYVAATLSLLLAHLIVASISKGNPIMRVISKRNDTVDFE